MKIKTALHLLFWPLITLLAGCGKVTHASTQSPVAYYPEFSQAAQASPASPKPEQIALLVPLSGSYAPYGLSIRNGFFAAFYDQKAKQTPSPTIRVYDTSKTNIAAVYKTAVTEGADVVVGPLQKNDIRTLMDDNLLSVPTLALNTVPDGAVERYKHLFTFGLSPIDEAQQAAMQAIKTHHQRVIIIAKNDAWSKTLVEAFSYQWQQLGGTIVAVQWINQQNHLSTDISDVLHITKAYADKSALERIIQEKTRFIPRRRQDFDSIFLVASPSSAKEILPLLRFYFANNIPVYATSQVYEYTANPAHNRDLDGIFFCDIPWMINTPLRPDRLETMRQRIATLWPAQSRQYARFFALGVDAFALTHQLDTMMTSPELGVPSATGLLTLTRSRHVYRQLPWAVIKKGEPELVSTQ